MKENSLSRFFKVLITNPFCYMTLFAVIVLIGHSLVEGINVDEREHFYATYLVSLGQVPYKDFFEHHNPLLWYVALPIFYLFDENVNIWYVLRLTMTIGSIVSMYFIYKIIYLVHNNKKTAILGAVGWSFFELVRYAAPQFRPDPLMMLFYVIGFYYFLLYLKNKEKIFINVAMGLFFVSFLFLQKIVILLVPLGCVVLWLLFVKKILWKDLLLSLIIPFVLGGIFLGWLWSVGALEDYIQSNYLVNSKLFFGNPFYYSGIYYVAPMIGVLMALWLLYKNRNDMFVCIISVLYLADVILVLGILPSIRAICLFTQYYLLVYPFLVMVGALFLEPFVNSISEKRLNMIVYAVCVVLIYHIYLSYLKKDDTYSLSTHVGLDRIIIENSTKNDAILCNLDASVGSSFRRCVTGYYFFAFHLVAPRHQYYAHGREIPRINDIVKYRRPKIVASTLWADNCVYNAETTEVDCKNTELDLDFMYENYHQAGFIWLRKQ